MIWSWVNLLFVVVDARVLCLRRAISGGLWVVNKCNVACLLCSSRSPQQYNHPIYIRTRNLTPPKNRAKPTLTTFFGVGDNEDLVFGLLILPYWSAYSRYDR